MQKTAGSGAEREAAARRPRGRPRSPFTEGTGGTVQALDRGLQVLRALAQEQGLGLSELAARTGLPVSSLHRILATLEAQGFARLDVLGQTWAVGVEAFRIGAAFARQTSLLEVGRSVMQRLMHSSGETVNMAIPDGPEVVFIGQVETHQPIRAFFRPGTRSAMHASGIGKALLAAMPAAEAEAMLTRTGMEAFTAQTRTNPAAILAERSETAARGWALDDEERHLGMRCVAAAIHDQSGAPVAGISISGPTVRLDRAAIGRHGPAVAEAAAAVTDGIGGQMPRRDR